MSIRPVGLVIFCYFRNLSDVNHDNMLDASEFTTAIHLLQFCLRGNTLPKSLPPDLKPTHLEEVNIDPMTQSQFDAYQRLFDKIARSRNKIPGTGNIFGIIIFLQVWDCFGSKTFF